MFPLPTLLYAGYSVKLIKIHNAILYYLERNAIKTDINKKRAKILLYSASRCIPLTVEMAEERSSVKTLPLIEWVPHCVLNSRNLTLRYALFRKQGNENIFSISSNKNKQNSKRTMYCIVYNKLNFAPILNC